MGKTYRYYTLVIGQQGEYIVKHTSKAAMKRYNAKLKKQYPYFRLVRSGKMTKAVSQKDWRVGRAMKSVGLRKNTRRFDGKIFRLDHVAMLERTRKSSRKKLKAMGLQVRTTKTSLGHYAVWTRGTPKRKR